MTTELFVDLEKALRDLATQAGFQKKKKKKNVDSASSSEAVHYWSKGTGYGHNDSSYDWNVSSFENAATKSETATIKACSRVEKQLAKALSSAEKTDKLVRGLARSCLLPFLSRHLGNDSFVDMERHVKLYTAVVALVRQLAVHPSTERLLHFPVTKCNTRDVDLDGKPTEEESKKETSSTIVGVLRQLVEQTEAVEKRHRQLLHKTKEHIQQTKQTRKEIAAEKTALKAAKKAGNTPSAQVDFEQVGLGLFFAETDEELHYAKVLVDTQQLEVSLAPSQPVVAVTAAEVLPVMVEPAPLQPLPASNSVVAESAPSVLPAMPVPEESLLIDDKSATGMVLKLAREVLSFQQVPAPLAALPAKEISKSLASASSECNKRDSVAELTSKAEKPMILITTEEDTADKENQAPLKLTRGSSAEMKRPPSYVDVLTPLRFAEIPAFTTHHYRKNTQDSSVNAKTMRRIISEFADLSRSLPITSDSSVFMRVSEENLRLVQMMIIAPPDTPYAYGCFLFDICLPTDYPNRPPQVNLQTTGKGAVRFNPNLYACGKVCLSLLGTWSGGVGETWMPNASTLLQLAVSIQSLIFVPEPYFNEPGYEASMSASKPYSDQYNRNLEPSTVQWAMLDMIRNPPTGFEEVVRNHFKLQRASVLKQLDTWEPRADSSRREVFQQLREELAKL